MEDSQKLHTGLVVRTTREYLVIWSNVHDLVRAPEFGLNSQWPIGSWVKYRAIADDRTSNRLDPDMCQSFTAYEILREPNSPLPEVNVRRENGDVQIELVTYVVAAPLRYLDSNTILVDDFFLGPILGYDAELIRVFEENLNELIELKVMFTEQHPEHARFVAFAFKNDSNGEWIELKNVLPFLSKELQDPVFSGRKEFGTFAKKALPVALEENGIENCPPSTSNNKFRLVDEPLNHRPIAPKYDEIGSTDEGVTDDEPLAERANGHKIIEFESEEDGGESVIVTKEERAADIIAEMSHYQKEHSGEARRKRSFGLVVEKMLDYAVIYTKKFGLAILPSSRFPSLQQFDSMCVVGQWLLAAIVEVPDCSSLALTFSHMCLPPFERTSQENVQTSVNLQGKVEILLNCDFSVANMKSLSADQYLLSTELGDVIVSERFIRRNEIFENVSNVWVRYIGGKYFFWEIDSEAKLTTDDDIVSVYDDAPTSCVPTELESVFTSVNFLGNEQVHDTEMEEDHLGCDGQNGVNGNHVEAGVGIEAVQNNLEDHSDCDGHNEVNGILVEVEVDIVCTTEAVQNNSLPTTDSSTVRSPIAATASTGLLIALQLCKSFLALHEQGSFDGRTEN
uniref:Uncharacterized protein n=1 Tax=Globodera rostochiensis TaxID=31243 RepID=A0A914HVT4_GLORO